VLGSIIFGGLRKKMMEMFYACGVVRVVILYVKRGDCISRRRQKAGHDKWTASAREMQIMTRFAV
jgi:hypothetical protein